MNTTTQHHIDQLIAHLRKAHAELIEFAYYECGDMPDNKVVDRLNAARRHMNRAEQSMNRAIDAAK